jgi:hypothetical protein
VVLVVRQVLVVGQVLVVATGSGFGMLASQQKTDTPKTPWKIDLGFSPEELKLARQFAITRR